MMGRSGSRLLELCDLVSSGVADQTQVDELESLMANDEQARQTFLDWSAMQVDLYTLIDAGTARLALRGELESTASRPSLKNFVWLAALAASVAIALFAVNFEFPLNMQSSNSFQVVEDEGIGADSGIDGMAVVSRIENVAWSNSSNSVSVGDLLKSNNWIEMESGVAEIEFGQGAVVVLEGPARFVAKSTSVGVLDYGKLAAVVPPWAEGFRVDTPSLEVVDRGTQFIVEVTRDKQVNVGVTKGEVEVSQQASELQLEEEKEKSIQRLFAGNAVQSRGDMISEMPFDEQWHTLSEQLPIRPDHTEVEVMARYRRDFITGIANEARREGNWRYFANTWSSLKDKKGYKELLWDSRRAVYDPNGDRDLIAGSRLHAANLSYRGGHPGQGRDQTKDDLNHYVIAAYQVPKDGQYYIKSGWLVRAESRDDISNQSVDLRLWVNSRPNSIEGICNRDGLLKFKGELGDLNEGDWIYVAVGPNGVAYNDRFEWDFAVVRTLEVVEL